MPNLTSTSPTKTLTELFNTDPLELTNSNVNQIVAALREQRKKWEAEESRAAASGKRAKKVPLMPDEVKKLDLGDLGL